MSTTYFFFQGATIDQMGSLASPWQLTAYLVEVEGSWPGVTLTGSETVPYKDGAFTFTDLGISHSGDYQLEFVVTCPVEASHIRSVWGMLLCGWYYRISIGYVLMASWYGTLHNMTVMSYLLYWSTYPCISLFHCLYFLSKWYISLSWGTSFTSLLW